MQIWDRLVNLEISNELLRFRDQEALRAHLESLEDVEVDCIGQSRESQDLFGIRLGSGPRTISVIAGCHADEPAGPMAAQALPVLLPRVFPELLTSFSFCIVPQMNPDGAACNRVWFSDPPDLFSYLNHVVREEPADDIEFGFADHSHARPECRAAMRFLKDAAPIDTHFSLHGMAFGEGVWFLLNRAWIPRAMPVTVPLAGLCGFLGLPLHDLDRHGEKGFHRICPGFCTTPTSGAMRQHFLDRGDKDTAAAFGPSSMEFVASLGGDPLCMVSEVPLFRVGKRSPATEESNTMALRDEVREATERGAVTSAAYAQELESRFRLAPLPMALQVRLLIAMIVLALDRPEPA